MWGCWEKSERMQGLGTLSPGFPFLCSFILCYVPSAITALLHKALLLTEAPLWSHLNFPTKRTLGGRCSQVGEACPEAALAWHHLCLAEMAGEVKEAERDKWEDVYSPQTSPQHHHCLLCELSADSHHHNSTILKHARSTMEWLSLGKLS